MRAAFITVGDVSRLTGGYLYHARVFERLGEFGVEVEAVVPSGAAVDEQEEGIPALELLFDPCEYDVVVVDALARAVCAPFIEGWKRDRPVVAMVHELASLASPEDDTEEERAFEDALLGADMFIAVSGHGKSVLEGRGVPSGRIRVVSPGFDGLAPEAGNIGSVYREDAPRSDSAGRGESFRSAKPVWDTRRGEDRRDVSATEGARRGSESGARTPANSELLRAICVAQWIERKGVLDLVEAWRSLEIPNASLHLIGETDADSEYRSRVMSIIGEGASITVSGRLDDESLAAEYAESDIFVLPSRYEGYGIVFAEALSFGLPVVACDVGPVPELVGGEAGIFVSPGDVEGLARTIHNLLSDGNLRRRMSEAALRRTRRLPLWEDTTRGFAEVLREAVGRG